MLRTARAERARLARRREGALTGRQLDDLVTAESRARFNRRLKFAEWLDAERGVLAARHAKAVADLRAAPQFSEASFAAFAAHFGRGDSYEAMAAVTGQKADTLRRNAGRMFGRVCELMGLPLTTGAEQNRAEAVIRLVL